MSFYFDGLTKDHEYELYYGEGGGEISIIIGGHKMSFYFEWVV